MNLEFFIGGEVRRPSSGFKLLAVTWKLELLTLAAIQRPSRFKV